MNIALLSPSKNSYSETFIQAQKERLKGTVFYYYDGFMPTKLEGFDNFIIKNAGLKKKLGLIGTDILAQSFSNSLKKHKIDIVLAHYGPTGEAVAEVCKQLKIPLVVHFHGYDASITSVINVNNRYKHVFEIASYVIAVSKDMQIQLKQLGCPESKIIYNPCAPDDRFIEIMPKFTKQQFVSIGRFTDKKAPYLTILAFNEVLKKHPHANLLMAGEGPLLNTCKNLVELYKLSDNITFLGVITQDEFRIILIESLAFVQHSITADNGDKEGTPVAILEASGAGLPVIATNHAGIPDVILHKETGILVAEKDAEGMTDAMLELLKNPDYAKELGAKGKLRIKTYYNMINHINTLQNLLKSVIK